MNVFVNKRYCDDACTDKQNDLFKSVLCISETVSANPLRELKRKKDSNTSAPSTITSSKVRSDEVRLGSALCL